MAVIRQLVVLQGWSLSEVPLYNNHVVVYNKKGQYVSNFGELPINSCGIAMDRDGFLFVGCYGSNKIVVL